jgi:hypothetical protein
MQDANHLSMLAIWRNKALDQLLRMSVIPHGRSSVCRPKFYYNNLSHLMSVLHQVSGNMFPRFCTGVYNSRRSKEGI